MPTTCGHRGYYDVVSCITCPKCISLVDRYSPGSWLYYLCCTTAKTIDPRDEGLKNDICSTLSYFPMDPDDTGKLDNQEDTTGYGSGATVGCNFKPPALIHVLVKQ
jgi:hypothetical protein